jgi:hypothetical protein
LEEFAFADESVLLAHGQLSLGIRKQHEIQAKIEMALVSIRQKKMDISIKASK